ncbi:MAG: hypothetical protein HKN43_16110 [Rhodothermales bacterium]|nr:hypothetical protein [Rhodothermales bacterium]
MSKYYIDTFSFRYNQMRLTLTGVLLLFFSYPAFAQAIDTVLTWRDYSRLASTRVRVYNVVDDKRKTLVVVIDEQSQNGGAPAINDARFVIQKIGKDLSIDPSSAYWVFRWTIGSFSDDCTSTKELLVMATMGRSKTNTLTGPSWKIVDSTRLLTMTDRKWDSW